MCRAGLCLSGAVLLIARDDGVEEKGRVVFRVLTLFEWLADECEDGC